MGTGVDLILTGAAVHTVDPSQPWAEALAVRGGQIAAVGSRDDVLALRRPDTRIHDLPDFVHFPHRVHVANNIRCQECHGPIQDMVRVRQAASLSMGWCVNCHRQPKSAAPSHWKRTVGPLDCAACHW